MTDHIPAAPTDTAPKLSSDDMIYMIGLCLMGRGTNDVDALSRNVGENMLSNEQCIETGQVDLSQALHDVVKTRLPQMNREHATMSVDENGKMSEITYLSGGMYPVTGDTARMLENLYGQAPVLDDSVGNKLMLESVAGPVQRERLLLGQRFMGDVQEHATQRTDISALTQPPAAQESKHKSFMDNVVSLLGNLFHKKSNGPKPR